MFITTQCSLAHSASQAYPVLGFSLQFPFRLMLTVLWSCSACTHVMLNRAILMMTDHEYDATDYVYKLAHYLNTENKSGLEKYVCGKSS